MAKRFLSDIHATAGLKDSSGDLGSDGQVLSSTGSGTNWVQAGSGATVIHDDQFTATANQTAFTLSNTVDAENKTQVYIDGAYQAKAGYTVSGTTLTFDTGLDVGSKVEVITFATAIASNATAVIKLDEFVPGDAISGTSGQNFTLSQTVSDEKVTQVYINGVYQHKDTYSISGTTLQFSSAPPSGSDIEVITFDTVVAADGTLSATTFLGDLNGTINTATTATTQSAGNNSTKISTTAYTDAKVADAINNGTTAIAPSQNAVFDALALKANLAGPTFTGTPAAPTASAGTNTTQLATTAFVTTGISNIVDSAPGTLNTLNELAAALGDDVNFSTTVTNSIATKLPLAGGTLTGKLSVSQSGADMIDLTRSSVGTYRLAISGSDAFSVFDVGANADRFIISSGGDATFNNNVIIGTSGASSNRYQLRFEKWNSSHSYPSITFLTPTGSLRSGIGVNTSNDFVIGRTSAAVDTNFTNQDLKISNTTGEATFLSSSNPVINVTSSGVDNSFITFKRNTSTITGHVGGSTSILSASQGGVNTDFIIRSENALKLLTNGNNPRLTIQSGGDSVFSGDVDVFKPSATISLGTSGSGGSFGFMGWDDTNSSLYLGHSYSSVFNKNLVISSGGVTTLFANIGSAVDNAQLQIKSDGSATVTGLMFVNAANTSSFNDLAGIASYIESGNAKGNLQFWTRNSDGNNNDKTTRLRISSTGALTITASANSTGNPRAIGFGGNSIGTNPLIYYDNAGNLVVDSTNSGKVFLNGDTTGDVNIAQGGGITYVGKTANGGTQQQLYLAGYPLQSGSSFFGSYGFLTFAATTNYTGSARRYALTNAYAANKFAILQGGSSAASVGLGAGGSALTGTNPVFIIDGLGEISGDFNDTSDISLKKDIESLGNTTELVKKLNPVSFYWNEKQDKGENKNIGFIAQQVEEVVPELVKGDEGGKSINVTGLVSLLTKTVQEQQTIIEDLKSRIETLEG